jgi:glycosyltransferase involved in cell wall biosynthesis
MGHQPPLVTIITPTYNRASFLDETVNSVLAQDYPNIEYIVLDDGSKDNTREVMEKYRERVHFESHPNVGETLTVNKGFAMARGEIICVVNSDDPLLSEAIRTGVQALQSDPEALAAYPDWDEIGPDSALIQHRQLPDYDIENMLVGFNVSIGPGVFIRRSSVERFGMRDPQFKYVGDLEFWFRLALHGKLVHIPKTLATHRVHPGAASSTDQGSRMADELVRMVHKIYSLEGIPSTIQRIRWNVLSNSHNIAACYCGTDRLAFFRHKFWYYWHAPQKILIDLSQRIFIDLLGKIYYPLHRLLFRVKSKLR